MARVSTLGSVVRDIFCRQMNVSRHEYERMYAQYLARVDENRRKHEAPLGRLQLLTYNHSGKLPLFTYTEM